MVGMGVGAVLGAIIGGVVAGVFSLGIGTAGGAMLGASIGSSLGGVVESYMFAPKQKKPNSASIRLQTSEYGTPIPVVYGERVVSGNCIWYGNFQKEYKYIRVAGDNNNYYAWTYKVSVAFAICANKIDLINCRMDNIYVDVNNLPQDAVARFYNGTQTSPDSAIQQILGSATPVWKGLSYIVFENLYLGTDSSVPQFLFTVRSKGNLYMSDGEGGVLPADVIRDALCNPFYGAGLVTTMLNWTSFDDVNSLCASDISKIDLVVDNSISYLDFIQFIAQHHFGLFVYSAGQFKYIQLHENMTPFRYLTEADIVKEIGKSPIDISAKFEAYNKVTVQYIRKDGVTATTHVSDITDIDTHGLKNLIISLDGYSTYERASKAASRILSKNITRPSELSFRLGINNFFNIFPGTVVQISNTELGYDSMVVIASVNIENDYTLKIQATEEQAENYNVAIDGSDSWVEDEIDLLSYPVLRPMAGILPEMYAMPYMFNTAGDYTPYTWITYTAAINMQYSKLYQERHLSGEVGDKIYDEKGISLLSGSTGVIIGVGYMGNVAYIDVTFDGKPVLSSYTSSVFWNDNKLNLSFVRPKNSAYKNVYMRYQTATLLSGTTWRLTDLEYDTTRTPHANTYGDIQVGDNFGDLTLPPHLLTYTTSNIYVENEYAEYIVVGVNTAGVEYSWNDSESLFVLESEIYE